MLPIPVPQGLTPQDVILTGTSSLAIGNGVIVKTDTGSFGTVANLGTGQTSVGVSSQVGTSTTVGNVVSEGSVFLANNAIVNGSVTSPASVTEQQGAIIKGSIIKAPVPTDSSRTVTVTFPTTAPSVTLQPGASQMLSPGAYGSVVVNSRATLSLSTGTYLFSSFDTEPQATLNLNETSGPIFIYVETALLYKGTESQIGGDGAVFMGFFGTQAVSLQAPYRGTLVAPNAPVELTSQSAGFAGAFWGSTLQVDPNSPITGIGALVPGTPGAGVTPTLNCVVQLSTSQFGAVFGYTNTTGANITLGTGPHNFFSPGLADAGQPILFLPGQVPIATFETFAAGSHLSYTVGQQTAMATQSSPACSAALASGLKQLYTASSASESTKQALASLLANPKFGTLISNFRTAGNVFTPFESSMLDALQLVISNADLLATPSTLTPAQLARIPAFRATLLANPAVIQMRLTGDAMRGNVSNLACTATAFVNANRPLIPFIAPQPGSLFAQVQGIATSSAAETANSALASVALSTGGAPAFSAAPGWDLAALLPTTQLETLQLGGPLPTNWLETLGGAITGAVIGATAGVIVGTYVGDGPGAIIGGIVGGVIGGLVGAANPVDFGSSCQNCSKDEDCLNQSGGNDSCIDGCCAGSNVVIWTIGFLKGTACAGTAQACTEDANCAAGLKCIEDCCIDPSTFQQLCPNAKCTVDSNCNPGNVCETGCCLGSCGVNGISCDVVSAPSMCGGQDAGVSECPAGFTCSAGCCVISIG